MPNDRSEKHLDVYEDRYELHQGRKPPYFTKGFKIKKLSVAMLI